MSLRKALINRDFARLWYGQAISTLGDSVFSTTLVLWVATVLARGKSWAPAAVSGMLLMTGAAVLLVGPLAGVFVDRWNRRATMLRTEAVRGLLVGFLVVLSILPVADLPVWAWLALLYCAVFALNAAGQFFGPARFATIGDVVTGETDRARAAGLGQATSATAGIIGPPLAAPLLFTLGLPWALTFNALSYVVSFAAIRSAKLRSASDASESRPRRTSFRKELASGLRYFRSNQLLVTILVITVICQCGTGALNALNVFFVVRNLHASANLYGYLGTALGAGAIVGALSANRVVRWLGARTTTWLTVLLSGLLILGYSRQTTLAGGIVLLFLLAVPAAMLNTALTPLMLAAASREYTGRVFAVFNPLVQLSSMLSVMLAGWLASSVLEHFSVSIGGFQLGPISTIFAASGVLVLVGGGYALVALSSASRQLATES